MAKKKQQHPSQQQNVHYSNYGSATAPGDSIENDDNNNSTSAEVYYPTPTTPTNNLEEQEAAYLLSNSGIAAANSSAAGSIQTIEGQSTAKQKLSCAQCSVLALITFVITLASFQFGFVVVVNSPQYAIRNCPVVNSTLPDAGIQPAGGIFYPCIPMTDLQWATAVSIYAAGGFIGGVTSGKISDLVGRRTTLFFNNFILLFGVMCQSLSSHFLLFTFGRMVFGIGTGVISVVVSMYLSEISPANLRGSMNAMGAVMLSIGVLYSQLIGIPLSTQQYQLWRVLLAASTPIMLLQIILLPFCPESPRWLVMVNKHLEAHRALTKLRQTNDVDDELRSIQASLKKSVLAPKARIRDLFKKSVIKPLIIAAGGLMIQQFSGVTVVNSFSTQIFTDAGLPHASIATALVGVVALTTAICSIFIVDWAGRRTLLILSEIGSTLALGCLTTSYILFHYKVYPSVMGYIAGGSVVAFQICFTIGLAPIPYTLAAEVFPTDMRGMLMSMTLAFKWMVTFGVTFSFVPFKALLGHFAFIPYTCSLIIGILFTIIMVPETKGKTMEEIAKTMQ